MGSALSKWNGRLTQLVWLFAVAPEHIGRLLLDIPDVEVARIEHQLGGARVEPLDF